MFLAELLVVLVMAFLVAALFAYPLDRPGPWGGFWWLFLILFLGTWAVAAWVDPVGPVAWGVAWVPIAVAALVIGLLIAAIPPRPGVEVTPPPRTTEPEAVAAVGVFFWLLVVALLFLIILPFALA